MFKDNINFRTRFRPVKGNKISMVVSAMLIGAVATTDVNAQNLTGGSNTISSDNLTAVTTADTNLPGSSVTINNNDNTTDIQINHNISATNPANDDDATIRINDFHDSNLTIASGKTVSSTTTSGTKKAVAIGVFQGTQAGANDVEGTIINNGTLEADSSVRYAIGIRLNGITMTNATVTNNGTIDTNTTDPSTFSAGIEHAGGNGFVSSTLTNTGTINSTTTRGGAYAIKMGILDSSQIINSGDLNVSVTDEGGDSMGINATLHKQSSIVNSGNIDVTNAETGATGIEATLGSSGTKGGNKVQNDGNITLSANGAALGMSIAGDFIADSGVQTQIINSGKITVSTTDEAYGIEANTLKDGTVLSNSGDINVTGASGRGIDISAMQDTAIMENNGTIIGSVSDGGSMKGIYIVGVHGSASVVNNGIVSVDGDSTGGTKTTLRLIDLNSSETVTNTGTLKATVNDKLQKTAYSLRITNDSTTSNGNFVNTTTGKMYGNLDVGGTASLTNNGLISLSADSDNAVVHNFTNSATGTLEIGLDTNGTTTKYSKITTSKATFADGTTINVNVSDASTNVNLLAGTTLNDVVKVTTSEDNLTIVGTLNVTDNSALLNFEYVEDNNTIDLKAIGAKTIAESVSNAVAAAGNKEAAKGASTALTTIKSGSYSQMDSVISALNAKSTDAEVAEAVESTVPVVATTSSASSVQVTNSTAAIVQQRQNITLNSGVNSGDGMYSDQYVWMKPYGSFGKQDDKDGLNGYDMNTYGIGIGTDGDIGDDHIFGLGFFYTNASVDMNNITQSTDMDVFSVLAYGNKPVIDSKTKLLYQAGLSVQKASSSRSVFTGDTATADFTGQTAMANVKLVRDYKVDSSLVLQPMVEGTYRHFTNEAYSESGAGALNLSVDEFTSSQLIVGAGITGYYKLDKNSKAIASLTVGYDTRDDKNTLTSSYQGASDVKFDTTGIDNGNTTCEATVGYESKIDDKQTIDFAYNYQAQGSSYQNNTVSAKYVLKF